MRLGDTVKPQRRFSRPSEKRSRLIQVRVTPAQHATLRAIAVAAGISLADVVRNALARDTMRGT